MPLVGRKGKITTSIFISIMAILFVFYAVGLQPISLLSKIGVCAGIAYAASMLMIGRNA